MSNKALTILMEVVNPRPTKSNIELYQHELNLADNARLKILKGC